jgi:predicted hotdog family 3-hydroxylacyl-ACP dehydratase
MLIDRPSIEHLIPHSGSMCLLDAATRWDEDSIVCSATSHRSLDNPLRRAGKLGAVCALEYAAQAMALHGALTARGARRSSGGLLASVRDLVLHRERLDDCGPLLRVEARRVLGESSRVIYEFEVGDSAGLIANGRAAVVLEALT